MARITTDAWVLYQSQEKSRAPGPGELKREPFIFEYSAESEVLAEPIYGCWEGNMSHAIERQPVDICRQRREDKIIIGNAGVVRILNPGPSKFLKEGDLCLYSPIGSTDQFGYLMRVAAYDMPNTMGLLARQIKLGENQAVPLPRNTRYSVKQWAGFSLRYPTAWANWKLAYGCWRLQMPEDLLPIPYVWGWGGGVSLAMLTLAKFFGCKAAMVASTDDRLALIREMGIKDIDRRSFLNLAFDAKKYKTDSDYKRSYLRAERTFLDIVRQETEGLGVSIFMDNIGLPVFRPTLKALGRQGVLTSVGWKRGMELTVVRATECISHHAHVFTHGARFSEGIASIEFAEQTGWLPPVNGEIYNWDNIPQLAHDFAKDKTGGYFPLYSVNSL